MLVAVLFTATAQYGPDPAGVPADFKCAWRKLTLDYATELRPDAAALVHDALTLTASCNGTVPRPTPATRDFPPTAPHGSSSSGRSFSVYVDGTRGSDTAAGTLIAPLKTLSAAVTKTRAGGSAFDEITVRAGTYRFTRDSGPLMLDERDSHLTIRNYPNETVWMSGATLLSPPPKWTPFQNTLTKMSAPLSNTDNTRGCALDDPRNATCGCVTAVDALSCSQMCLADERCTSYTMHTETSDKWAKKCCLRRDDTWKPQTGGKGHVSGQKIVGTNVWKADISNAENIDWSYGIPELRVNGARVTQARYPNANPETQFWPTGYLTSNPRFAPDGDWLNPTIAPKPNTAIPVQVAGRGEWESQFESYSGGINGTCSIYTPPFSFWCSSNFSDGCGGCFTWNIPSGLKFDGTKLPNAKSYTNVQDAQLFAWRKAHWANWMFDIESITMDSDDDATMGADSSSGGTIKVGSGGFQGARGGAGSDWFISNVLEELDSPGEFYLDKHTKTLYFGSNATDGKSAPSASLVIEAVQQHTLMSVIGKSMKEPVTNLSIVGIGFRDTAPTFMEPHGVPSGGDWALERFGALFVERSSSLTVNGCKWTRASGNGISLNRFNLNATIEDSTFEWMGGSAIAAWGFTDEISEGGIHGIDGTGGDFPRYTLVQRNLFREIGQWEKQSSAFFQAKTAQSTLRRNVVFNLARAGFNFNDGFGGGDVVTANVLFNTCRESSDHGPINSWDRQPFLTTVRTGQPSTIMAFRHVFGNFLISNYGGSKQIDNDDGSLFWKNYENVMVYGWAQKFKCGGIQSYGNYKAFIDLGGKFDAGCILNKSSGVYYPNLWHDDVLLVLTEGKFDYRNCWGMPYDRTQVYNNSIIVKSPAVAISVASMKGRGGGCEAGVTNLATLQKVGGDPGTTVTMKWPNTDAIIAAMRETLTPHYKED